MTETAMESWIFAHGSVGVVALAVGLAALLAPKRPGAHPWLGRAYLTAVALAMLLAAPVIIAKDNVFLMGMGLLVIAHGVTAWGAARWRPSAPVPPPARAAAIGAGGGFAAFAAWGAWMGVQGAFMGWVCVGMAAIGLTLVRRVLAFQADWRALHVHGAAGALISAVTAFAAATGPRIAPGLPEPLLWVGPSVVLTPVFLWLGRSRR